MYSLAMFVMPVMSVDLGSASGTSSGLIAALVPMMESFERTEDSSWFSLLARMRSISICVQNQGTTHARGNKGYVWAKLSFLW